VKLLKSYKFLSQKSQFQGLRKKGLLFLVLVKLYQAQELWTPQKDLLGQVGLVDRV